MNICFGGLRIMKNKKWIVVPLILAAAAVGIWFFSRGGAGKTLVVGVRENITDWSFYDEGTGKAFGMEVDLAYLIAEKAGYADIRFVPVDAVNGQEKLKNGEFDCLIFAKTSEEHLDKDLEYSENYYEALTSFLVKSSSMITSLEELSGRPVGVWAKDPAPEKYLIAAFADSGLPAPVPVSAEDYHELSEYLETGEVSALCLCDDIGYSLFEADTFFLDSSIDAQGIAVAVRKGDQNGQVILDAVNALIEEGQIDEMLDSWGWLL